MDTKSRIWPFGSLLTGIALLSVAFFSLDFRIAASNTTSEKNITTTSIGAELPYAMQRSEKINLALVGEGPLLAALQKVLITEMNRLGIGEIRTVKEIVPRDQSPILVVKVGKPGVFWTPFLASSRFTIQTGYSSAGDTSFLGETPGTVDNREGPVLNMYGEYKLTDRSWGLISRPGYHHILADYLAREIVAELKELYKLSTESTQFSP